MQTRRYAKRQLTWFRKNEKINWIYPDDFNGSDEMYERVFNLTDDFYAEVQR